ncbi:RING finger protein 113A [Chaetoceros tenuissimus]|uniref:RING finger protein 113A n=1 Tax=Chaetoceros tenuissimus TaxID=426638 RepID=A0AAD3CP28_9STRA|nr:RING finger protein 113A [Chaetoceros tenuissimus]
MFRKVKKNPKAKFRARKREQDDDDDNENKRQKNEEEETSTSALLEHAKSEQIQKNKGGLKTSSSSKSKSVVFQQYTSSEKPSDKDLATRTAQHHPEEKGNSLETQNDDEEEDQDKKLYKGNKETRNKFLAGPLKAPTFVRTTSRFDYQPDICKDYKDTGFCGFGDSCIYLHDRGNSLSGWQLEEEYEKKKKAEQEKKEREMDMFCKEIEGKDTSTVETNIGSDGLPFACYLCREPFTDPIVTTCFHYFCQKCIMANVKENNENSTTASTSSACPICGKDTHGVFNYPNKLYQKRRRMGCDTWEEFAEKSANK